MIRPAPLVGPSETQLLRGRVFRREPALLPAASFILAARSLQPRVRTRFPERAVLAQVQLDPSADARGLLVVALDAPLAALGRCGSGRLVRQPGGRRKEDCENDRLQSHATAKLQDPCPRGGTRIALRGVGRVVGGLRKGRNIGRGDRSVRFGSRLQNDRVILSA